MVRASAGSLSRSPDALKSPYRAPCDSDHVNHLAVVPGNERRLQPAAHCHRKARQRMHVLQEERHTTERRAGAQVMGVTLGLTSPARTSFASSTAS